MTLLRTDSLVARLGSERLIDGINSVDAACGGLTTAQRVTLLSSNSLAKRLGSEGLIDGIAAVDAACGGGLTTAQRVTLLRKHASRLHSASCIDGIKARHVDGMKVTLPSTT